MAIALFAFAVSHAQSGAEVSFKFQFADNGCSQNIGAVQSSPKLSAGGGKSKWASDSTNLDPSCLRVGMDGQAAGGINKDFRFCIQFAENQYFSRRGFLPALLGQTQLGAKECTAWASESSAGSWSNWASDADSVNPDGAWIYLETRDQALASPITDVRIGAQMSDAKCTDNFGDQKLTPWLSQGGGFSGWAFPNGFSGPSSEDRSPYAADCARVYLEATSESEEPAPISCGVATEERNVSIQTNDIEYVTPVRGQATQCSGNRILFGVDQQDHAGALQMLCANTTGVKDTSAAIERVALTKEDSGTSFHACPSGSILVGLEQNAIGRETAILCQKALAGSIDFSQSPITWRSVHGFSGDRKTFTFTGELDRQAGNFTSSENWAAIGAAFNLNPGSSRGVNAYFLKPISEGFIPAGQAIPCEEEEEEPQEAPNTCSDGLDNNGDGLVDADDPSCASGGTSESSSSPQAEVSCTFVADKTAIIKDVDSAILSWSCSGGSGVPSISDNNPNFSDIGPVSLTSSTAVSPDEPTAFTLHYSGKSFGPILITVNDPILEEQ